MIDGFLQCCAETNPTARKCHKCCECGGLISKGEKYQRITGLWEGKFETYKTCRECAGLRDEYNKGLDPYDQAAVGELFWDITESEIKELIVKALAILKKHHSEIPKRFEWLEERGACYD